jgi:hypothetical protein
MIGRPSVGLADPEEVSHRIVAGEFSNRPGCMLEVSTYVWNRNPFETQQQFEESCQARGIEWACP